MPSSSNKYSTQSPTENIKKKKSQKRSSKRRKTPKRIKSAELQARIDKRNRKRKNRAKIAAQMRADKENLSAKKVSATKVLKKAKAKKSKLRRSIAKLHKLLARTNSPQKREEYHLELVSAIHEKRWIKPLLKVENLDERLYSVAAVGVDTHWKEGVIEDQVVKIYDHSKVVFKDSPLSIPMGQLGHYKWVTQKKQVYDIAPHDFHKWQQILKESDLMHAIKYDVYAEAGFVTIDDGSMRFLLPDGAIGKDGVELLRRSSHPVVTDLQLIPMADKAGVSPEESLKKVITALQKILKHQQHILAVEVMAPLLHALIRRCFVLFKFGVTGSGKSFFEQIVIAFLGVPIHRNNRSGTAYICEWDQATESAMLERTAMGSGLSILLEDYRSHTETKRRVDVDATIRINANNNTRATNSLSAYRYGSPTAILRSNGECLPLDADDSLRNRMFALPMEGHGLDRDVAERNRMKLMKLVEDGHFANAGLFFIQQFLKLWSTLEKTLGSRESAMTVKVDKILGDTAHGRIAQHTAKLIVSAEIFYEFLLDANAISEERCKRYKMSAQKYFIKHAKQQKLYWEEAELHEVLKRSLKAALRSGHYYISCKKIHRPPFGLNAERYGWQDGKPQGTWLGYYDPYTEQFTIRNDIPPEELLKFTDFGGNRFINNKSHDFAAQLIKEGVLENDRKRQKSAQRVTVPYLANVQGYKAKPGKKRLYMWRFKPSFKL